MPSPRRSESNSRTPTTAETPPRPESEASPTEAGGLLFQRGSGSGSPGPENPPPIPDMGESPTQSPFGSTPGPSGSENGLPGGDPGRGYGSDPRSTPKRRKLGKRELRDAAKGLVNTAGGIAHTLLTRADTIERRAGLWLPDDSDVNAISDPLAGLASRRTPEGADNPDAADLVQLLVGVAGYVVKQLRRKAELRDMPPEAPEFYGEWMPDPEAGSTEPTSQPRDRAGDRDATPAAGPVAWLRRRHDGTGEATTDPQPDLDLTKREETAP